MDTKTSQTKITDDAETSEQLAKVSESSTFYPNVARNIKAFVLTKIYACNQ